MKEDGGANIVHLSADLLGAGAVQCREWALAARPQPASSKKGTHCHASLSDQLTCDTAQLIECCSRGVSLLGISGLQ